MPLPKFLRKTLGAVLNSPLLQALGVGDVNDVIKNHFARGAKEITQTYQNSYAYAFSAIAADLASNDSWQHFWQKITESRVDKEFSSKITALYLGCGRFKTTALALCEFHGFLSKVEPRR